MTRCFVIGPIGDRLAPIGSPGRDKYEQSLEVFENIIEAACTQVGLTAVRADHISHSGEITEQVFRHLFEDDIVIADVTDGNPNVMYELGMRHTRDLLTIQIGEYGQLPFDITTIRTIMFSRSPRGLIDARDQLIAALRIGLAEGPDPVTATKVWNALASGSTVDFDPEVIGFETETDAVEEDGYLDLMMSVNDGFPRMTETVEDFGSRMEGMASDAETSTHEMESLDAQDATASARFSAVVRFAQRLEEHAAALDELVGTFGRDMDEIDGSINGILEFLAENPEMLTEDADSFLNNIVELAEGARESMEGFSEFSATVVGLGALSKTLRRPGKRIASALGAMRDKVRLMDEWEAAVARLKKRHLDTSSPEAVETTSTLPTAAPEPGG